MSAHNWIPSPLGHGETYCTYCDSTNREIAAIGDMNVCYGAAPATPEAHPVSEWKDIASALNELAGDTFHLATHHGPTNAAWEQYTRSRLKWLAGKLVELGREAASPLGGSIQALETVETDAAKIARLEGVLERALNLASATKERSDHTEALWKLAEARAQSAESHLQVMREALGPFAASADTLLKWNGTSHDVLTPPDHERASIFNVTWGDIRKAREALSLVSQGEGGRGCSCTDSGGTALVPGPKSDSDGGH